MTTTNTWAIVTKEQATHTIQITWGSFPPIVGQGDLIQDWESHNNAQITRDLTANGEFWDATDHEDARVFVLPIGSGIFAQDPEHILHTAQSGVTRTSYELDASGSRRAIRHLINQFDQPILTELVEQLLPVGMADVDELREAADIACGDMGTGRLDLETAIALVAAIGGDKAEAQRRLSAVDMSSLVLIPYSLRHEALLP